MENDTPKLPATGTLQEHMKNHMPWSGENHRVPGSSESPAPAPLTEAEEKAMRQIFDRVQRGMKSGFLLEEGAYTKAADSLKTPTGTPRQAIMTPAA